MAKKQKTNKISRNIPQEIEARIVELSLNFPDYGPRRLAPLLKQEAITVTASAVYSILKRNNLQNRSLRLAKLEEQRPAETPPAPAENELEPKEEPELVPAQTGDTTPSSQIPVAPKVPSKTRVRPPWALTIPNLLLLGLIGYFWVSAVGNFLNAGREPAFTPQAPQVESTSKSETSVRPMSDYSVIAERNLFEGSVSESPVTEETVSLENIPIAEKDLGLKLVGTVVGADSATSFAIIDNKSTRKQELYHEGDKVGEILIKRILRNNVVIDAGRGDEVLTLELAESGKKLDFSSAAQSSENRFESTTRHKYLQLDRKEVEASLADIDGITKQVNLSPYSLGTRNGFMINRIPPDSILTKIGLRNGDVITTVNNQSITGPEDATAFLQTVREGGDVEITLSRRRRTTQISLKIE